MSLSRGPNVTISHNALDLTDTSDWRTNGGERLPSIYLSIPRIYDSWGSFKRQRVNPIDSSIDQCFSLKSDVDRPDSQQEGIPVGCVLPAGADVRCPIATRCQHRYGEGREVKKWTRFKILSSDGPHMSLAWRGGGVPVRWGPKPWGWKGGGGGRGPSSEQVWTVLQWWPLDVSSRGSLSNEVPCLGGGPL